MSVDLRERVRRAGEVAAPAPDLEQLWQRGRTRRHRRQTGVAAVAVLVMIGIGGVVASGAGWRQPREVLGGIDAAPGEWSPLSGAVDVSEVRAELVAAAFTEVARIKVTGEAIPFTVTADGTLAVYEFDTIQVLPGSGRVLGAVGRIVMRAPDGAERTLIEGFPRGDGALVERLQFASDGYLVATGQCWDRCADPGAENAGQTFVAVIAPDGELRGFRANDPGLGGVVFDGQLAWQEHEPGRWQAIATLDDGRVLQSPEQRGSERRTTIAPDLVDIGEPTFFPSGQVGFPIQTNGIDARIQLDGDRLESWAATVSVSSGARLLHLDGVGPDVRDLLVLARDDGTIRGVWLDPELSTLDPGAAQSLQLGGDSHLYMGLRMNGVDEVRILRSRDPIR